MKKLWLLLLIPVFGAAALVVYQNLPEKRFARHLVKARLYTDENNLTAAQLEYEAAYNSTGKFTPYASLEVLRLMNLKALQDKDLPGALENSRMFVKEHPENKTGRLILAELAFQAGELETAFESVDSVLAADPGYFPARLLLTRVRTLQGRLDLAEEQLRYLYRKHPDSLNALIPLAENLLKQGKVEESRRFLAEVMADNPASGQARLLLVDCYLAEQKPDSAHAVLEAWQKGAPPESARPLAIRRGRYHAFAGRFGEAEAILAQYREPKEENAAVLAELAVIKAAQGQYDSALRIYAELGETLPALRPASQRMSVMLHLKAQNPARALETSKLLQLGTKSLDQLPYTLAAYQSLGQDNKAADLIAKQPDSLQPALRELLSQWPPDKAFIGQWALTEYFRQNNQGHWAFKAGQDLYRQWPGYPLALNLLTSQLVSGHQYLAASRLLEGEKKPSRTQRMALLKLYTLSGQQEKAVSLSANLLEEDPGLRGLNLLIADHAMRKGNKAKAIAHYGKELDLDSGDLASLNNLAWEYGIVQGDFERARPYLEKLRARKIQDPRILDTMGWILAKNGSAPEGRKLIREALNLVPDHPVFLFHMGWILDRTGDKEAARSSIQTALASKLPFGERKEAEALLAGLD